jgi:hypothetical protein
MDLDIRDHHRKSKKEHQKMERLISINLMHLFAENKIMKMLRKMLLFTQPKILSVMIYLNKLTMFKKIKIIRIRVKNLLKIKIIIKIKKVF